MRISDWSSDVCSSDLPGPVLRAETPPAQYWRRWCDDAPAPELPAAEDAPAANEPLPQVLPHGDGADAPYRVLIVEDDPSQALFAETVLNGTGMHARVVGGRSEVMATMEQFRPDLLLPDLPMPAPHAADDTPRLPPPPPP